MTNLSNSMDSAGSPTLVDMLGPIVAVAVYILATILALFLAIYNRKAFRNVTRAKDPGGKPVSNFALEAAPPSFSRISGIVGLAYLTAFCWGLGLFALIRVWDKPAAVAEAVKGSGDFIMALSALFAPYAFNQLSQVFGGKGAGTAGVGAPKTPAKPRDKNQMLRDIEFD